MKRFLACSLSALLLSSAVACSTAPAKEEPTETLKVYYINQTGSEEDAMLHWLQQSADSWEKDGYEVRLLPMFGVNMGTGFVLQRIIACADSTPDLTIDTNEARVFPDVLYEGLYADLTEYLETDPDKDDYLPNLLENITLKEKLYGIPISMNLEGLWYNKKLLKEAGYPEGLTAKTGEEFFTVLETIQQKLPEVQPFWYSDVRSILLYIAHSRGEEYINPITMDLALSEETIKEAMKFVERLAPHAPPTSGEPQSERIEVATKFQQQKLAIALRGDFFPVLFGEDGAYPWKNMTEEVGYAPFPSKEGKKAVSMGTGWYFGIPELSKQKEEAYEFIRHCMSEPQYSAYVLDSGVIATRQSILQREDYLAQPFKREQAELLPFCRELFFWEGVLGKSVELSKQLRNVRNGTPAEEALNAFLG